MSEVERGRELYARRAWAAAYESLSAADPARLSAGDLELLAISAFMSGRDDAYVDAWELAYHAHLRAGDPAQRRALHLVDRRLSALPGRHARAPPDGSRAGIGFSIAWEMTASRAATCCYRPFTTTCWHGDHEAASAVAAEAGRIGERFGDRDLSRSP